MLSSSEERNAMAMDRTSTQWKRRSGRSQTLMLWLDVCMSASKVPYALRPDVG